MGTGRVSIGKVPVAQGENDGEQIEEMVRVTKVTTETRSLEAAAEQEIFCRGGARVQKRSATPPSNRLSKIMRSAEFGEDEVLTKSGRGGEKLGGLAEFKYSLQNDADRNRD
jgi:hypothetical protein